MSHYGKMYITTNNEFLGAWENISPVEIVNSRAHNIEAQCSACGGYAVMMDEARARYCPNCGRKMRRK